MLPVSFLCHLQIRCSWSEGYVLLQTVFDTFTNFNFVSMKHFHKKFLLALIWGLLLAGSTLYGQRQLTGRVTDSDNGEPLIGASVIVKGTTVGAVADVDGRYTLRLPEGATELRISYTGYSEQTIAIGASDVLDVQLSPGAALEEVLVIGYGSVKKEDKTGSVQAVTSENFNSGAIVSPEQQISGKIAGVQVSSNGGEPGGGRNIFARRRRSCAPICRLCY